MVGPKVVIPSTLVEYYRPGHAIFYFPSPISSIRITSYNYNQPIIMILRFI